MKTFKQYVNEETEKGYDRKMKSASKKIIKNIKELIAKKEISDDDLKQFIRDDMGEYVSFSYDGELSDVEDKYFNLIYKEVKKIK